tara:strand:- start:2049 stop:3449 length:1401 start_codon:yes stop_codon:yes gene_type:complete
MINQADFFIEGEKLEKICSDFSSTKRTINSIDMNKVIFNKLFSQIRNTQQKMSFETNSKRKLYEFLLTVLKFIKISLSVIIYKKRLIVESTGKINIWVLKRPGELRPSYVKEFNDYKKNNSSPDFISWGNKKNNILNCFKRLLQFYSYLKTCNTDIYTFNDALNNARLILDAIDLSKDKLWENKPLAILSLKDFSGLENSIIQIANSKSIPTFTTQDSVHHFFKGKNFREANLVITNCVASNILCWGEYLKNIFDDFYPKKNVFLSSANFRPALSEKLLNNKGKNIFVFALGGIRHLSENHDLITLASKLDQNEKDCMIYIRYHPSISNDIYEKLIDKLNFKNETIVENSSMLDHNFHYPINSLIITGMSGVYYDYLYLGYKVIIYKYGFELLYDLPRVFPYIENEMDLFNQIKRIRSLDKKKWENMANLVLAKTVNHSINGKRRQNVVNEIELILKDYSSKYKYN